MHLTPGVVHNSLNVMGSLCTEILFYFIMIARVNL